MHEELLQLVFLATARKPEHLLMKCRPTSSQAGDQACRFLLHRQVLHQALPDHKVLDLAMILTARQAILQPLLRADLVRPAWDLSPQRLWAGKKSQPQLLLLCLRLQRDHQQLMVYTLTQAHKQALVTNTLHNLWKPKTSQQCLDHRWLHIQVQEVHCHDPGVRAVLVVAFVNAGKRVALHVNVTQNQAIILGHMILRCLLRKQM